jgi:AraC family transcriptional regulator
MTHPVAPSSWADRMLRVVDHIQAHLDAELRPEQLAAIAGFSLHHFHRVFRGMVGQSVMDFVRDQRLERAAFHLKYGDRPVTQIAFDAGYGSHEAFTRAFKTRFDAPPSSYRDTSRALIDDEIAIVFRREAETPVLCWRRLGEYDGSSDVWAALLGFAGAEQLLGAHTRFLGFVLDDPDIVPSDRLRYDAALTLTAAQQRVLAERQLPAGVRLHILPAGNYARALHVGPYHESARTYVSLLGRALPSRGVELMDDPVVECYLNSPADTPPAELRTEILVRLQ